MASVITSRVTEITITKASSGGTITNEGSGGIIEKGICWSTNPDPSISDIFTMDGGGKGAFASSMTDLDAATDYYVRAYAKNEAGIAYGSEISFTTLG